MFNQGHASAFPAPGARGARQAISMGIAGLSALLLSGCSLIPDLSPEALAANRAACESVATTWNSLSAVFEGGDLAETANVLAQLPQSIRQAIETSTDAALDDALIGLEQQIDAIGVSGAPNLSALAQSGAALAARCTVFGVTPNLTLPGM